MKLTREVAEQRVAGRVETGKREEHALLEAVKKTVIVDRLVPPSKTSMRFCLDPAFKNNELRLEYTNPDGSFTIVGIHQHAFGQLCEKVKLPMTFANALRTSTEMLDGYLWKMSLLIDNLNTLFHNTEWPQTANQPPRFLHRIVDNELRGFLSRRYNRYLASAPLLSAFVDVCRSQRAQTIEATATAVRSSLKCVLPTVYEPFPGEFVCIGTEWSNSDFGAGKLSICQTVWRVLTGSSSVLDESISRVHLGAIIQDGDLEVSDDTARKEVVAQQAAIADVVKQHFSTVTVDRLLQAMRVAHEEEIPWSRLKFQLGRILSKVELEWMESTLQSSKLGIIDLPPVTFTTEGEATPNAYWAASVVSLLASGCEDDDRKLDLQREAGKLLGTALKS